MTCQRPAALFKRDGGATLTFICLLAILKFLCIINNMSETDKDPYVEVRKPFSAVGKKVLRRSLRMQDKTPSSVNNGAKQRHSKRKEEEERMDTVLREDFTFEGRETLDLRKERYPGPKPVYQHSVPVTIPENIASSKDYQNRIIEQLERTANAPRTPAMERYRVSHESDLMRHNIVNGNNGKKPRK